MGLRRRSSASDSASSSSEDAANEETKQEHWTGVKPRIQLTSNQLRVYDIKSDLEALVEEKSFKETNTSKSNAFLFDTDTYERNDASLVPENHALTEA